MHGFRNLVCIQALLKFGFQDPTPRDYNLVRSEEGGQSICISNSLPKLRLMLGETTACSTDFTSQVLPSSSLCLPFSVLITPVLISPDWSLLPCLLPLPLHPLNGWVPSAILDPVLPSSNSLHSSLILSGVLPSPLQAALPLSYTPQFPVLVLSAHTWAPLGCCSSQLPHV